MYDLQRKNSQSFVECVDCIPCAMNHNLLHLSRWIPDNVSVCLVTVPPVGQKVVCRLLTWVTHATDPQITGRNRPCQLNMYPRGFYSYLGNGMSDLGP